MQRSFTCSPCPACGVRISTKSELPFISRQAWRDQVADALGYRRQFIQSLGVRTRIHAHHFEEHNVRNGKPVGLPTKNIIRVAEWPTAGTKDYVKKNTIDKDPEINVFEYDNIEENTEPKDFVIVNIKQLKLLFHQCHFCGQIIVETSVKMTHRGGVLFVKYFCSKCNKRRFWSSSVNSFSETICAAAMLNGIAFTKMLRFFMILNCAFPSIRTIYYASQYIVRPIIQNFYQLCQQKLINHLRTVNDLHLCMDGQFDSPGSCAYHCTVTAIESTTRKIIGFKTVKRNEVQNRSPNAEPAAFRFLLNDILGWNLRIQSVTTDGSKTLSELFATEFPEIHHFLDMWHILKNMYKKFMPKFSVRKYPMLRDAFCRITRFLWQCRVKRTKEESETLMLQKVLSCLFHIVGIHSWRAGKFVEIFQEFCGPVQFPTGLIEGVEMRQVLQCDHGVIENEKILNVNSLEFALLIEDICSDIRLSQLHRSDHIISRSNLESYQSIVVSYRPKRYHFWYLDIRNMLAVLHNNENVNTENSGKRCVTKKTPKSDKGTNQPNDHTVILNWQKEIIEVIKANKGNCNVINYEKEILGEYVDLEVEHVEVNENDENIDLLFDNFFVHVVTD